MKTKKVNENVSPRCGVLRFPAPPPRQKRCSRAHQRNESNRKTDNGQRNAHPDLARAGERLTFAPHLFLSDSRFSSVNWVGKTVAEVRVSPIRNGKYNCLLIIFTDKTEVCFCGTDQSVVWATLFPEMQYIEKNSQAKGKKP